VAGDTTGQETESRASAARWREGLGEILQRAAAAGTGGAGDRLLAWRQEIVQREDRLQCGDDEEADLDDGDGALGTQKAV